MITLYYICNTMSMGVWIIYRAERTFHSVTIVASWKNLSPATLCVALRAGPFSSFPVQALSSKLANKNNPTIREIVFVSRASEI